MAPTRRRLLAALTATGAVTAAGCLDRSNGTSNDGGTDDGTDDSGTNGDGSAPDGETDDSDTDTGTEIQVDLGVPCAETDGDVDLFEGQRPTDIEGAQAAPETDYGDGEIPLRDDRLYLGHDIERFAEEHINGGVNHDGIPSIDEPEFLPAADAELPPCERVFGVSIDGDVRAYPQRILVRHEVVNDVVGGRPVAVTYCPLTGTAQGFYRGGVEFGVSGELVNSNLIMWDRAFDVRWPQVAATGVEVGGERGAGGADLVGRSLQEFRVVWTTWERWRDRHPETLLMTADTGFARNYSRDPYGSYTPVSGHYAVGTSRRPDFPLLAAPESDEKRVVLGARTTDGAIAVEKRTLLEDSVLTGTIGDTPVVAVADEGLSTGYVYANPDALDVTRDGEEYVVDGDAAPAGDLPLESIVAFEAMWFVWHGYYPDTERVGI